MEYKKLHRSGRGNIKPGRNSEKRQRAWAITAWIEPTFDELQMKYLVYGKEVCPDTGRIHFQTYVYFFNAKTFSACSKFFPSGANRLSPSHEEYFLENLAYCTKDKDYKEFGTRPEQGKRTDLNELRDQIIKGKKVDEIVMENPTVYHQYGRTLHKIEDLVLETVFRTEMPEVIWYYGKTGTGKSHKAFEGYSHKTHYMLNWSDGGFWEGYKGQKTVIINEFRGEIPFKTLLEICDKFPFNCKRKGRGPHPLLCSKVIITSCKSPQSIYNHSLDDEDKIDQFLRRCTIIELKKRENIFV